jgi:hypothetical protein
MPKSDKISQVPGNLHLDEVDRRMVQELIANPAASNKALASLLDMERRQIGKRRKNPEFQRVLAEYQRPCQDILKQAQPIAARVLKRQLQSNNEKLAFQAAIKILKPVIALMNDGEDEKLTIKMKMTDGRVMILGQGEEADEI